MREFTTPGEVALPASATLLHPLWYHARKTPDATLLVYNRPDGTIEVTAAEFAETVQRLALGLIGLGVRVGDRVAIMSKTRVEWTFLDYAITTAGAATVPIRETSPPDHLRWILSDSAARLVFFGTPALKATYETVASGLEDVDRAWVIEDGGLDQLIAAGDDVDPAEISRRDKQLGPETVAQISYTSGTTGRPKGCVTTHGNLRWDAVQTNNRLAALFRGDTSTLLFLPLAHSFGKLVQGACVESRTTIGYATEPDALAEDMQAFRPTFVISVPQTFRNLYDAVRRDAEQRGRAAIFDRAAQIAVDYSRERQGGGVSVATSTQHRLFDRLVYREVRRRLGGRVECVFAGGAPLDEWLAHFFTGVGVDLLEGWGLTETSAVSSVNTPSQNKVGTAGRPLSGCSLRIDEDGEILVRGGNVFAGYLNDREATDRAFTDDGWFRSGDLGSLDRDGFLSITGRKGQQRRVLSGDYARAPRSVTPRDQKA